VSTSHGNVISKFCHHNILQGTGVRKKFLTPECSVNLQTLLSYHASTVRWVARLASKPCHPPRSDATTSG